MTVDWIAVAMDIEALEDAPFDEEIVARLQKASTF